MLHDRTIQHITNLSNEALAEYIASGTEVYEADAIALARDEFQKRGLAPEDLRAIQKIGGERAADAARIQCGTIPPEAAKHFAHATSCFRVFFADVTAARPCNLRGVVAQLLANGLALPLVPLKCGCPPIPPYPSRRNGEAHFPRSLVA
jgi:hypothetical protein